MPGPSHLTAQSMPHPHACTQLWAGYLVSRGWPVFQLHSADRHLCSCGDTSCKSPSEHPRSKAGVQEASADPDLTRRNWDKCPDANIGIPTGVRSGLVIFAINQGHGEASFKELQKDFPDAFAARLGVRTGTGATHLYFECRSPTPSLTDIRPGIDIKGRRQLCSCPIVSRC